MQTFNTISMLYLFLFAERASSHSVQLKFPGHNYCDNKGFPYLVCGEIVIEVRYESFFKLETFEQDSCTVQETFKRALIESGSEVYKFYDNEISKTNNIQG